MADNSHNQYTNTFLTKQHDITGVTRRKGMTTSIISAFPNQGMGNVANKATGKKGTLFGGVLTILAIMIGSGVIGIPYAAYKLGLALGLAILYVSVFLCLVSADLLYESSRLTGCKSLSEIGFY